MPKLQFNGYFLSRGHAGTPREREVTDGDESLTFTENACYTVADVSCFLEKSPCIPMLRGDHVPVPIASAIYTVIGSANVASTASATFVMYVPPRPFTASLGRFYPTRGGGGPDRRRGRGLPCRDLSPSGRDSGGIVAASITCRMPVSVGPSCSVGPSETQRHCAL
jgi:hypothetical protein